MSSISLGSPHASPFCLATTNISSYLGQMNAFTAKWVNTSTRTWSGNAYCVGSIVPNAGPSDPRSSPSPTPRFSGNTWAALGDQSGRLRTSLTMPLWL